MLSFERMSITIHFPGGVLDNNALAIKELSETMLTNLEEQSHQLHYSVSMSDESLLSYLESRYERIQAAGGVVLNEKGELLMIFRRGKWDLPKGKLDPGETLEDCAVREVSEETGLQHLELGEHLIDTWHAYFGYGQWVLKQSSWFRMKGLSSDPIQAQTEEDIEQCLWLSKFDVNTRLETAHQSLRPVLDTALDLMP